MRRNCIVLLGAMGVLAATAALAWACTPQSFINLNPTSARSGDTVTVTGKGFISGPVEIHWNGTNGPLLTTATGPSFTVNVTIPSTGPGTYYVQGVARTGDGAIIGNAVRALQVQAAPAASPSPKTSAPATNNAAAAPAPSSKPTATAPTRTHAQGQKSPVSHARPVASNHPSISRSSASHSDHAPAPSTPAIAKGKSGQAVFADSLPPVPSAAKSATSLGGWHPFNQSHIPSLVGGPAAGHATTGNPRSGLSGGIHPTGKAITGGSGSQLAIGAGVLGLGLVLLFGGFAIAEVRRRRVPAGLGSVTTRDGDDREADRPLA